MRTWTTLRIAAIALVPLTSLADSGSNCKCQTLEISGGWCRSCEVGYIAGLKVESEPLFESLENHGHHLDRSYIKCESCLIALDNEGFCETCQIGFIDRQAYFSALAYELSRGDVKNPEEIKCEKCKLNIQGGGWCETCKLGMLGNVAISDRKGFERALPEYRRLLVALKHLDKCETCAMAIATNGMCPKCRIEFKDGKPTSKAGSDEN